jgi:UDP-2,3-diacylglucosamine pyrophosphatase LpxH
MSETTIRVFLSDIHMGDEQSQEGKHPYGWLRADRADLLARLLSGARRNSGVIEVVLVGDLFDEWAVPYTVDPVPKPNNDLSQYRRIADAPVIAPVMRELRAIAQSTNISAWPPWNGMPMRSRRATCGPVA